jgi:RNA polymerase sigma factor (sigma-70 family)
MDADPSDPHKSILEQISTRWSLITDPMQFVLRYGPAVRAYLTALIPNRHDAEDVTQEFLMRVLRQPVLVPERVRNGRFRDYLKAALRNAAIDHFRKRSGAINKTTGLPEHLIGPEREKPAEDDWNVEWRRVLLDRCWESLEAKERQTADNFGYTALKLTVDFPDLDSPALAAKLSAKAKKPFTAEAYRKQLSRARKQFAQTVIDEVKQTLESPTAENVVEELIELDLIGYVKDFLPEKWRQHGG